MARRRRAPRSLAERIRGLELDTWEQTTQIVRRIGIEVSWAKIADIMISGEGVESDNFVTGVSGWMIDGDGNAEFNNVTVRGTIYASAGSITGALTIGSAGSLTTESTNGEKIVLTGSAAGGKIEFRPRPAAGTWSSWPYIQAWDYGILMSSETESAADGRGTLQLTTGYLGAASGRVSLQATGAEGLVTISGSEQIFMSSHSDAGAGNVVPYDLSIGSKPSTADLFNLTVGSTNYLKVRNDGRMMTYGAYIYFNNSNDDWLGLNTAGNLSMSGNVLYFANTSEYIQLSDASNWFRIVQDGVETHRFESNGNIAIAGQRIVFDIIGGNEWIDMNDSTQQFRIGLNGVVEMTLGSAGFLVPNVYNSVTSSYGANVYVHTDTRIYRSTVSLSKYKDEIKPWKPNKSEGSVLDLTAVSFYPKAGNPTKGEPMKRIGKKKILGFTYEDTEENFPKGIHDEDSLNWNAIIVGLQQELKQLRQEVDELKAA